MNELTNQMLSGFADAIFGDEDNEEAQRFVDAVKSGMAEMETEEQKHS